VTRALEARAAEDQKLKEKDAARAEKAKTLLKTLDKTDVSL
jgi:hypothetical protein